MEDLIILGRPQLDNDLFDRLQQQIQQITEGERFSDASFIKDFLHVLNDELDVCKEKLVQHDNYCDVLQNQSKTLTKSLQDSRRDVENLNRDKNQLLIDKKRLEVEHSMANATKSEMLELLNQRNDHISCLRTEISEVKKDLILEKANLNEKQRAFHQKESELIAKDESMQNTIVNLQERVEELTEKYRQAASSLVECENKLSECVIEREQSLEGLNTKVKQLTSDVSYTKSQLARKEEELLVMQNRLDQVKEKEEQFLSNYQTETAQLNKVIVSQQHLHQALEKKALSLKEDNNHLNNLLASCNQAEHELERIVLDSKRKFAIELQKRDEENLKLREQIRLMQQKMQENIEHQVQTNMQTYYPTSSAVSNILRNQIPLSLIYTEYERLQEKHDSAVLEIKTLREQLANNLVDHAQNKQHSLMTNCDGFWNVNAPSIEPLNRLYSTLLKLSADYETSLEDVETYKKQVSSLQNECDRYQITNNDLTRQIRVLLRTLHEARGQPVLDMSDKENDVQSNNEAQQMITKQLVTFRSIEELQQRNQQLLCALRQMCRLNEDLETQQAVKYASKIDELTNQVENMEEERRRGQELIAEFFNQKDINRPNDSFEGSGPKFKMSSRAYLEKKVAELEDMLNESQIQLKHVEIDSQTSIYNLEQKINKFEQIRLDLSIENNRLVSELDNANNKIRQLGLSIQSSSRDNALLKDTSTKLQLRIKMTQDELSKAEKENQKCAKRLVKFEQTVKKLEAEKEQLKSYEETLLSNESNLETDVKKKTLELLALKQRFERLEQSVESNKLRIKSMHSSELNLYERKVNALQAQLTQATVDCEQLRHSLTDKEDHICRLNIESQQKLSELQSEKETVTKELAKRLSENQKLSERLIRLEQATESQLKAEAGEMLDAHKSRIQMLENNLMTLRSEQSALINQKNELADKLRSHQEQLNEERANRDRLLAQLADNQANEQRLIDLGQKYDEAIKEKEKADQLLLEGNMRMKIMISQQKGRAEKLNTEIQTSRQQLEERDRTIERLRQQLLLSKKRTSVEVPTPKIVVTTNATPSMASTSGTTAIIPISATTPMTATGPMTAALSISAPVSISATVPIPAPVSVSATVPISTSTPITVTPMTTTVGKPTPTASIRPLSVNRTLNLRQILNRTAVAVVQPNSEPSDQSSSTATATTEINTLSTSVLSTSTNATSFASTTTTASLNNSVPRATVLPLVAQSFHSSIGQQETSSSSTIEPIEPQMEARIVSQQPSSLPDDARPSTSRAPLFNEEGGSKRALSTDDESQPEKRARTDIQQQDALTLTAVSTTSETGNDELNNAVNLVMQDQLHYSQEPESQIQHEEQLEPQNEFQELGEIDQSEQMEVASRAVIIENVPDAPPTDVEYQEATEEANFHSQSTTDLIIDVDNEQIHEEEPHSINFSDSSVIIETLPLIASNSAEILVTTDPVQVSQPFGTAAQDYVESCRSSQSQDAQTNDHEEYDERSSDVLSDSKNLVMAFGLEVDAEQPESNLAQTPVDYEPVTEHDDDEDEEMTYMNEDDDEHSEDVDVDDDEGEVYGEDAENEHDQLSGEDHEEYSEEDEEEYEDEEDADGDEHYEQQQPQLSDGHAIQRIDHGSDVIVLDSDDDETSEAAETHPGEDDKHAEEEADYEIHPDDYEEYDEEEEEETNVLQPQDDNQESGQFEAPEEGELSQGDVEVEPMHAFDGGKSQMNTKSENSSKEETSEN